MHQWDRQPISDRRTSIASDILLLAVLAKALWDLSQAHMITLDMFVIAGLGLSFLLGISNRLEESVLRIGLTLVVLITFAASLFFQGLLPVYFSLFLGLGLVYTIGKIVRLSRWVIFAVLGLLVATVLSLSLR
jgi:hypothetical protein